MAELEFPLAKEAGMRGVIFYDIGIAEDDLTGGDADYFIDTSGAVDGSDNPRVISRPVLRSDFGFGIRWFSPMGPLRFEFGFPLERDDFAGDRSNNFQFAVGSPF